MRYDIPQAQISHYKVHKCLPLEETLSASELKTLGLLTHVKILPYTERRDLFFRYQDLIKILSKRKFKEMIRELTGVKELRLISDQLFVKEASPPLTVSSGPINGLFPFQNIVIGILFALEEPSIYIDPPLNPGDVLFIDPSLPLQIDKLCSSTPHYLALYGTTNTLYVQRDRDPATNLLKKRGYFSGDRLRNEDYPYL